MAELLQWYHSNKDKLHPVELAARIHFQFAHIYSFVDGNGRTARLLMNFILMKYGYPPAVIKAEREKRLTYYKLLEMASLHGEIDSFILFVAESVEESLKKYLAAVE